MDTRQRILDIASELFRERGYAGTSVRDIAERLGMTKAALYYHFACKDDVLNALLAPTMTSIEEFLQTAEAAPAAAPATVLREVVEILARNAPATVTALGDPVVLRAEAGRFRLQDKQVRLVRLIAGPDADEPRLLRARAALGAVRSGLEALTPPCETAAERREVRLDLDRQLETVIAAAVGALDG